jgi:small-conductance mechanosensitive channel
MLFQQITTWFRSLSPELIGRAIRILLYAAGGFVVVRILIMLTQRLVMKKSTLQRRMIVKKVISYAGFVIVLMTVLAELGVKLTALLGAAGVVGIAVGFASQTSVANIISGLFLISEKPFTVGDVIRIGGTTGIIQSIDLLSIKIRTFDNLFVRIPNEKILNSEVTNITRFPIRRMDITLQVGHHEDLGRVHKTLQEIARGNPRCLDEPSPLILFSDFKESGIEVLFGLWFTQPDYLALKNSMMKDITARFKAEGISFAYPRRLVSGDATVRLAGRGGSSARGAAPPKSR